MTTFEGALICYPIAAQTLVELNSISAEFFSGFAAISETW
jgi:hypothetical protein